MADKMMRVAGRNPEGNAKPFSVDKDGNIGVQQMNKTVTAEYTLEAGKGPLSYHFITSKTESIGDSIKVSGYKYMDLFIVATEPHEFGMATPMYQRILQESTSGKNYRGDSANLGLFRDNFDEFVRDYKLSSGGGDVAYIKEMRVFGNYFTMFLSANKSDKSQDYLMLINLYN